MSSYTEEPEEWRPVAISILEKAGLPTSDRRVTKLMRDLEILDLEEDWQSLVLRFRNNVPMVVKPHHRFCSAKCGPLARD